MDLGHYVLSVYQDGCPFGRAESDVENGALLSEIDFISSKHRVDVRSQARFLGQLDEHLDGFVRNAILRVVQEDAYSLGRHPFAALGVLREEVSQMQAANLLVVGLEIFPSLPLRQRFNNLRCGEGVARVAIFVLLSFLFLLRLVGDGSFDRSTFFGNHYHQLIPGLDEGLGAFILKTCRQRVNIDAGFAELCQHLFAIPAIRGQACPDFAVIR